MKNCIIFSDCHIKKGAQLNYTIMDSGVTINENAKVDGELEKITLIGSNVTIGKGKKVVSGEIVNEDV